MFLVFSFSFFCSAQAVESKTSSPFVWLVKKGGKTSYFLGTVHVGVSLEEIPCSNTILKKIQNSDLLFAEKANIELESLSREEQSKLFIGSREEKEEIMSRLSKESQEMVKKRKQSRANLFIDSLPHQAQSLGNEDFENLSPERQSFLIEHGADIDGNYVDFYHFIILFAYYKAFYSFPHHLDKEIKQIAISRSIEIKALDDDKKINEDFRSKTSSNKPLFLVDRNIIEEAIRKIDYRIERYRQKVLKKSQMYKSYDANHFKVVGESLDKEIWLKNRNELWLQKFKEAQKEYENIFLMAGLGHFVGAYNILDMLVEKGFSIESMTCSN